MSVIHHSSSVISVCACFLLIVVFVLLLLLLGRGGAVGSTVSALLHNASCLMHVMAGVYVKHDP